jgi:hypothetical protein
VAPEGEAMGYVDNTVIGLVNVAQLVAMYCLVLFYHDLLQVSHSLSQQLEQGVSGSSSQSVSQSVSRSVSDSTGLDWSGLGPR